MELDLDHYAYDFPEGESPADLLAGIDVEAWATARKEAERITTVPATIDGIIELQRAQQVLHVHQGMQWALTGLAVVLLGAGMAAAVVGLRKWARRPAADQATQPGTGPTAGSIFSAQ